MKKSVNKIIALLGAGVFAVSCAAVPTFAYSKWNVSFPRFKGDTDIISQTKQTTYASHTNVDVSVWKTSGYTNGGEFLIRAYYGGGWQDVSARKPVYSQNGTQSISMNNSRATKGVQLMLVGRNPAFSTSNVSCAGTVDFH